MIAKPVDPGVPGWVLNMRVMFEERYWNYLDVKNSIATEDGKIKSRVSDLREKLEKSAKEYLELVPQQIKFYDTKFFYETLSEIVKREPECNNLELICSDLKTIEDFSTHLMKFPGKFKNGFHSLELGLRL